MAAKGTMKALVKHAGKVGLEFRDDSEIPEVGPKDVSIRVMAASICGSDLHIYDDDPVFRDRVEDGRITGHEFCGEIVNIGSQVTTLAIGDIISAESHVICGSCYYCLNGQAHICQEVSSIGVDRPGGFAEYAVIPAENAVLTPPDIPIEVAAFLEPFGNAVYTTRYVDLVSKSVLISGCGPQGMMAIAVAKAAGAKQIIATEPHEGRQELARRILEVHSNSREKNFDIVINPYDPTALTKIYEATNGIGVDVVLEMSGSDRAIEDGVNAIKKGGHYIALGLCSKPKIEIDWNSLVLKEVTIRGIYGRLLYQTWFEIHRLLESGKVILDSLIYPKRFSLEQFEEAFNLLRDGKAAKVILYPNGTS